MMRRLLMGASGGVRYVGGSAFATPTTRTVTWPGGAAPNRLAVIWASAGIAHPPTLTGSGWTEYDFEDVLTSSDPTGRIWWKLLAAADMSAPPTVTFDNGQGHLMVSIFAGVTTAALRSQGVTTGAQGSGARSLTGFTKTPGSKLLALFFDDRNTSLATQPTSSVQRLSTLGSFGYLQLDVMPPGAYANGSTFDWTGVGVAFAKATAQVLELS